MTHTHFIGIGGTGLSAIAKVLLERDQKVSGSDRVLSPLAKSVQEAGAIVYPGHAAKNVQGADIVVRSSAVPDDNVEVVAARDAGIPVLKRADFLEQLLQDNFTIAIAGSHGKTSTTSMVAWLLHDLGIQPGFIVGSVVNNLNTNASAGISKYFVIEADEYDYMFWGLTPEIAVVTNVEHDHPDCFPTPESFEGAFMGLVHRIKPDGILVACLDDPGAAKLLDYARSLDKRVRSYSLNDSDADYTTKKLSSREGAGFQFMAFRGDEPLAEVSLQVPGKYNVLNALGTLIVVDLLGLDVERSAKSLNEFSGAGRRFEILGEADGVLVIDDYGHHPTEIKATLAAARARYPKHRIWAVWQPHTYSRTQLLLAEFGGSFKDADQVIVTKVYAARETQPDDFSHKQIVDAIKKRKTHLVRELDETAGFLLEKVKPGDVVIVFSAGDAVEISALVYSTLKQRELGKS